MKKLNKALIITVAGTSSRFKESLGLDVLKCLYTTPPYASILDNILSLSLNNDFNKIVIIGGYRFIELQNYINSYDSKGVELSVLYNDKFENWGSNYSLYIGLEEVLKDKQVEKVVFAEGDLVFDKSTFKLVCESTIDVITSNANPIIADVSVAFYTDIKNKIKYCYDQNHRYLEINEPFSAIYNSGQIWSFSNMEKLRLVLKNQTNNDLNDTNLNIIQNYFNHIKLSEVDLYCFKLWFNCNTVQDYLQAIKNIEL